MNNNPTRIFATAALAVGFVISITFIPSQASATKIFQQDRIFQVVSSSNEGNTILTKRFRTRSSGKVALFYSAECAVFADAVEERVAVQMVVDDVLVPVTETRNLCSSNGADTRSGYSSNAVNATVKVGSGVHLVEIIATGVGLEGADLYWIADQSLTIIVERR